MKLSRSDRQSTKIEENWLKELKKSLESFKKTLTLREVQLTMILFVIEHRNVKNFKNIYINNYGTLGPFIIHPDNVHK
jgi:hypothetical protein